MSNIQGGNLHDIELTKTFPNSHLTLFRESMALNKVEYTLIVRDKHTNRLTHRSDITLDATSDEDAIRYALLKNMKVVR